MMSLGEVANVCQDSTMNDFKPLQKSN